MNDHDRPTGGTATVDTAAALTDATGRRPTTMRRAVFDRYGPPSVVQVRDVPVPPVGEGDVLVRVQGAAVNPYDWHFMIGLPRFVRAQLGLRRPKVSGIGADLAGRVEAVGPRVERIRPGDDVYGRVDVLPGSDLMDIGAAAEYVVVSEDSIRPRPQGMTAEEAAGVPLAGITALWAMQDVGRVRPGQHVLVNGASGGVGTYAVQIAKAMGAEVTGVCSTRNVGLVRSLGADHVVDHTREDVTRGGPRFDLMLDNVGSHTPAGIVGMLRRGGRYLASFDHPHNLWLGPLRHHLRTAVRARLAGRRATMLRPERRNSDLDTLSQLIEAGRLRTVVDRTFPLAETRQALEYLASRRARGKVIITP